MVIMLGKRFEVVLHQDVLNSSLTHLLSLYCPHRNLLGSHHLQRKEACCSLLPAEPHLCWGQVTQRLSDSKDGSLPNSSPRPRKTWIALHPWIKHFQPLFDLDFLFVNIFIISFLSPWIGHRLTPNCGLIHTELNCIANFRALNSGHVLALPN